MTRTEATKRPQLTVASLIETLQQMPPDALVWADGCDCTNPVVSVDLGADGAVEIGVEV